MHCILPYAHCSLLQVVWERVKRVPKHRASQGMTGALGSVYLKKPSKRNTYVYIVYALYTVYLKKSNEKENTLKPSNLSVSRYVSCGG